MSLRPLFTFAQAAILPPSAMRLLRMALIAGAWHGQSSALCLRAVKCYTMNGVAIRNNYFYIPPSNLCWVVLPHHLKVLRILCTDEGYVCS